jgi:hypothetical protein
MFGLTVRRVRNGNSGGMHSDFSQLRRVSKGNPEAAAASPRLNRFIGPGISLKQAPQPIASEEMRTI